MERRYYKIKGAVLIHYSGKKVTVELESPKPVCTNIKLMKELILDMFSTKISDPVVKCEKLIVEYL